MARRGKIIRFPKGPSDPEGRGGKGPGGQQPRGAEGRGGQQSRGAEGAGGRWLDEQGFVEVHRCRGEAEALVLKGLFDSERIPCLLRSRLVHSVHPFTVGAQGEVSVLVPEAEAPRARLLLARISPGPSFP